MKMTNSNKRIVVGISGASGAIYGIRLLKILVSLGIETHLIVTKAGKLSIEYETDYSFDDVVDLADYYHPNTNIAACIASGSFLHDGMVIAPCTVKTLSEVANCVSHSLISRAADVTLKDRRKLILLFRETPLHLGHIKLMQAATESGAIIMPCVTTFYNHPRSIDDMIDHTIARILDLLGLEHNLIKRWEGLGASRTPKS